jgi:V/A-type H+-transporting ATPase subunit D
MAKIKLTKTELKTQTDALKRFQRFLPMLQLKKQQLQAEIAAIAAKAEEASERESALRKGIEGWVGLLATDMSRLDGLVRVKSVKTGSANVAGVTIPVFIGIDAEVREIDKWESPAWLDAAAEAVRKTLEIRCERAVYEKQLSLVSEELRLTSQRVNLFEKVKIPDCKEAIRIIRIALGDEQTASVTRGKIAKSRVPDSEEAA